MKNLITFIAIALLSCVSSITHAQSGFLTGEIRDENGSPLPYANIAVMKAADSALVAGTVTGADGKFSTPTPVQGSYFLRLSSIGFAEKRTAVFEVTSPNFSKDFGSLTLEEEAKTLQEVTVQALRPTITHEADRMVVSIEGTALAAGSTAFDVLAKSPGVFIDQEGNIQLNGRAGASVMIDGRLTYLSARDLRTMLEGMSAENIKNIEIITNPSSKYDAEGSSGILNINLRKNEQRGMSGSLYTGYTYNGKQHGYSTGGTINYKAGSLNSFLTVDMARRVGGREATFTRVFAGSEDTKYFDQEATANWRVQAPPSFRLGSDYNLEEGHSIGFMAYVYNSKTSSDFLTDTYIGDTPKQPELYIDAKNYAHNRFTNYTANLHYLGKLDTVGTTLSADLDFVKIRNLGESNFYNYYYDLGAAQSPTTDFLYTKTPNGFDIYSAKVDFTQPFTKEHKLELGVKASRVISDNDSRFYFNNGEEPVLDPNRTNHFVYNENIYAGYLNWRGMLGERFTVQAGLRAEQTVSEGESRTTGQLTTRSYLNLFPSMFVQQKINDNYGLKYNYSRRIRRPNYGQLNPFTFYRDPFTWIQGNPNLQPQYSNVFGITQTFKQTYSLELNYQYNQDVIAELPLVVQETASTIYYTGNVDNSQNLSLTALVPFKVIKNWETNNTFIVSYNEFSAVVNNKPVLNSQIFYMLQSNHNILLPLGLRMEVNSAYVGPGVQALYHIDPRWWVHLGLKKSFWDEKVDVSVNANDIFKSMRLRIAADVGEGNISEFDQYFRTRSLGLTLRYRFNKGEKFEERRRSTNLEELNRTGN